MKIFVKFRRYIDLSLNETSENEANDVEVCDCYFSLQSSQCFIGLVFEISISQIMLRLIRVI